MYCLAAKYCRVEYLKMWASRKISSTLLAPFNFSQQGSESSRRARTPVDHAFSDSSVLWRKRHSGGQASGYEHALLACMAFTDCLEVRASCAIAVLFSIRIKFVRSWDEFLYAFLIFAHEYLITMIVSGLRLVQSQISPDSATHFNSYQLAVGFELRQ